MPVTEKTYPDWVQAYRTRGTTVKKKGNAYYLYKRTSKRVAGKKYPQPVDTYIGLITPEGVIKSGKRKLDVTAIEVMEFGFSKALKDLCPQSWKEPLGDDWEDVFLHLLRRWSPRSYLLKEKQLRNEKELHCSLSAQYGLFSRRIFKEHGIDINTLKMLDDIYLIDMNGHKMISRITDPQRELMDHLGINPEVD